MREALKFVLCLPRRILSVPVKLYRRFISPAKGTRTCRFVPSCSEYALIALDRWGAICGTALAVWRILRCSPFGKGGYDPVPERRKRNGRQN